MQAKLKVSTRSGSGKGVARKLRRDGRLPGIVYGRGGGTDLISMGARETHLLLRSVGVDDTVFELSFDDERTEYAKVQEVQTHPYRPELLHIDFMRVDRGA